MKQIKNQIKQLIDLHLESLLDSHLKYGGVYLAVIDMTETDDHFSLEVELDYGTIAFSIIVSPQEVTELAEFLDYKLRENGIGVFRNYLDFEDALEKAS